MNAIEQYCFAVHSNLWMKPYYVTIQLKASEWYLMLFFCTFLCLIVV